MQECLLTGKWGQILSIVALIACFSLQASGQNSPRIEFKKGDRVVLLGNALIENEQKYNYLEFTLSRHWPERSVTFRNLGWSGDNVFGQARSYFTSPPSPFELLLSQISEAEPDYVFLAYGSVEAHEGEAGIVDFKNGLERLVQEIKKLESKIVFISPLPQFGGATPDVVVERNSNLEKYTAIIRNIAAQNEAPFVDTFTPFKLITQRVSDDGVHLNDVGYYLFAREIEKSLGLSDINRNIRIHPSGTAESELKVKINSFDLKDGTIEFEVHEPKLTIPLPKELQGALSPSIQIEGLRKGFYMLSADGIPVATASARGWAEGVRIHNGGNWIRSANLRRLLNRKDEVFFFKYRPLNRTYIIGFREYEQGRHKKELDDFNIVLTWLQGQITEAKQPQPVQYTLVQLK